MIIDWKSIWREFTQKLDKRYVTWPTQQHMIEELVEDWLVKHIDAKRNNNDIPDVEE